MEISGKTILGSIAAIGVALAVGYWAGLAGPAPEPERRVFRMTGPVEFVEGDSAGAPSLQETAATNTEATAAGSASEGAEAEAQPSDGGGSPSAEPAPVERAVGDDFELAMYRVAVVGSEESASRDSGSGRPQLPAEGKKFVVVSLEITNTAESSVVFHPRDLFALVDGSGAEYEVLVSEEDPLDETLTNGELRKDVTAPCVVAFEVAKEAAGFVLHVRDASGPTRYTVAL